MLYIIFTEDFPNSLDKRLAARPEHLARLNLLKEQQRLVLAGPHPANDSEDLGIAGFTGSTIIAEFASQAEAEQWAAADPYHAAGVIKKTTIKPLKRSF